MMDHDTIEDVRRANRQAGQHFFDEDTMRFFRSRVHSPLYGGRFFVTSEKGPTGVRRYTVRVALPDGRVSTHGEFEQYASRSGAHAAAERLAREWAELTGQPFMRLCAKCGDYTEHDEGFEDRFDPGSMYGHYQVSAGLYCLECGTEWEPDEDDFIEPAYDEPHSRGVMGE